MEAISAASGKDWEAIVTGPPELEAGVSSPLSEARSSPAQAEARSRAPTARTEAEVRRRERRKVMGPP